MAVLVRTGTYRYVPPCALLWYKAVRTGCDLALDGTYRYVPVRTGMRPITESTYQYVLFWHMTVHGGTWQYMQNSITVYGSTWRYMALHFAVYHGLWQYMAVQAYYKG